jgi:hypothetical protein
MTDDDVLAEFRDAGALLEGHFILPSGLAYASDKLPSELAAIPAVKPGSRGLSA